MKDTNPVKNNQLVLSALGEDRAGIIDELSRSILDAGCTILDSRMSVLGGTFALLQMIGGNWNNIAKLETQLPGLADRLGLTINSTRAGDRGNQEGMLPYGVDVIAMDQPGIVHHLARFFSQRQINIQEMATSGYAAAHTGTPMFSVHLAVEIPAKTQISGLREDFMDLCDQLNLDAVIEPVKG